MLQYAGYLTSDAKHFRDSILEFSEMFGETCELNHQAVRADRIIHDIADLEKNIVTLVQTLASTIDGVDY